jgi:tRNA pseudouridine38-40 synthase
MQEGANRLLGTQNFSSFANKATEGSCAKNPIRTIETASWMDIGPIYRFQITGNGFFYKMVRNIVGSLVDVGRGYLSPDDITEILHAKDRKIAGASAPPQGLFLQSVEYGGIKTIATQELHQH